MIKNENNMVRTYGHPPFCVAVIHGGPGAGGEMAPVARRLSSQRGILEPIQTAPSLDGQVEELRQQIEAYGALPITLIGYSWGAWLSFITAARYPALVRKLILISSGPFEAKYVAHLEAARFSRLTEDEQAEFTRVTQMLGDPLTQNKDALLARLGSLASKTDAYDPILEDANESDPAGPRGDIFQGVWNSAAELRRSGKLLELADQISCPVIAIQGDYDPHPAEGVQKPLSARLADFQLILLEKCGHTPWAERQARETFYRVLNNALD